MNARNGFLSLLAAAAAAGVYAQDAKVGPVHSVVDLSHSFTFYADGRFAKQYLGQHRSVMNWNALYNFDLSNANLMVLLDCDERLSYTDKDVACIKTFLDNGGGVALFVSSPTCKQAELAKKLGAVYEDGAAAPFKAVPALNVDKVEGRASIKLADAAGWTALITDANGATVAAMRKIGNGRVMVAPRGFSGSNPDASDPINAAWLAPVLERLAQGKVIDASKPFNGRGLTDADNTETHNEITLYFSDYLTPYAKAMLDITQRTKPFIEKRMGVPLSGSMGSKVGLLATGGGGFSGGTLIGLAVWWGGFPEREDSMIEFITHESTHSWVLPFPEIWNEPIATYVGNLVMIDMGHKEEAERRIADTIKRARRHDPDMKLYDIWGKSCHAGIEPLERGKVNDLEWGKTYWIFEELRKEKPDFLATYFQLKRKHATPDAVKKYTADITVALLSKTMGRDLFPWFREMGFDVSADRADITF
ncbi:MAG: hypothetical protein FWG50_13690 [Kiritimatiellaeota bacterium]|nr:hypothetical protein [Kiritimatiellota bacterium]